MFVVQNFNAKGHEKEGGFWIFYPPEEETNITRQISLGVNRIRYPVVIVVNDGYQVLCVSRSIFFFGDSINTFFFYKKGL